MSILIIGQSSFLAQSLQVLKISKDWYFMGHKVALTDFDLQLSRPDQAKHRKPHESSFRKQVFLISALVLGHKLEIWRNGLLKAMAREIS